MRVLRAAWQAWRANREDALEQALEYADAAVLGIVLAGDDPDQFPAVAALSTLANEVRTLRAEREALQ